MHTIRRLSGPYGAGRIDVTERSKEKRITGSVVVRMLEILILSAAVSIGCLCFFYLNRFRVQEFLMYHTEILSNERDEFIQWMNSQSRNYKMYPTGKEVDEADREMLDQEYLPFLFAHRDPYASFWIYNDETGRYVTGYVADVLADKPWLLGSSFLEDQAERVETLKKIRQQALEMAGGNLECPIKVAGNDEISSLAQELDYLRCALKEQIEEERKSYQANRELIRAVSIEVMANHGKTGIIIKNRIMKNREAAGSGVGLKSARCIAQIHQWSLTWEEEDGVFSVVLLF